MLQKCLSMLLVVVLGLLMAGCNKTEKKAAQEMAPQDRVELGTLDKPGESSAKRIVGYYTSWSGYERNVNVSDIDGAKLTHLNFAFANLKPDGTIVVGDPWIDTEKVVNGVPGGHFGQIQTLKKKYPHLKVLISVGGWSWSGNFSDVAANATKRARFAQSAVDFVTKYGLDGVDVDWEYPVSGGNHIVHRKEDKENFALLLKETRKALDAQGRKYGKRYLLSIAAGADRSFVQNTNPKRLMESLDYINVMTYDYHGGWDQSTGHNTPLYSDEKHALGGTRSIDETIEAYFNAGVRPKDLNLGLALYGRGWTNVSNGGKSGLGQRGTVPSGKGFGKGTWEGGIFDFSDLDANYINQSGYRRYWDTVAKTPYLYNGKTWITYDDPESMKYKLEYAEKKGLGGVMFWEYSGDRKGKLLSVIADYFGKTDLMQMKLEKE